MLLQLDYILLLHDYFIYHSFIDLNSQAPLKYENNIFWYLMHIFCQVKKVTRKMLVLRRISRQGAIHPQLLCLFSKVSVLSIGDAYNDFIY